MTPTISVAAIIKNEEEHVMGFLDSLVTLADEIILIDTGSTDTTVSQIKTWQRKNKCTLRLFRFQPEGVFHFGIARNFSLQHATGDYVLILDADERVSVEFAKTLKPFLREHSPMVASIVRVDALVPHLRERHDRIIKNGRGIQYGTSESDRLHEHLIHSFVPILFTPPVVHDQGNNHWIRRPSRMKFQMRLEVAQTPKTKSFWGHIRRGVWAFWFKFKKVYISQETYKDGWRGLYFSLLRGLYAFLVQYHVARKSKIKI